jgi:hypothetical protein
MLGKSVVICMRTVSERPNVFRGGETGYIHPYPNGVIVPKPKKEYRPPNINTDKVLSEWKRAYPNPKLAILAHNLGVSIQSLERMGCQLAGGWNNAWAFPMSDGYGNHIGIRIRNLISRKWAVTGSRAGIFIPNVRPVKRLFVVEGPTDTAAGIDLGLYVVGRPSCSGGGDYILDLARNMRVKEVVIITDNDEPGVRGSQELQKRLKIPSCVLTLPCKDLREYLQIGDRSTLDSMVEQLAWTQPKNT